MRASDLNRKRKLQFGQAVLLGVVFEQTHTTRIADYRRKNQMVWHIHMPSWHKGGYISGPYKTRWEAAERALKNLGVIPELEVAAPLPDGTVWRGDGARNFDDQLIELLPPR